MQAASLDKTKIRRSFAAAALTYDSMAMLQRQVGLALLRRFPVDPAEGVLVDLGCGTGFLCSQIAKTVANKSLIALDIALPMLEACRRNHPDLQLQYVCADGSQLPFMARSVQQIYSNLALQWLQDLSNASAEFRRVLQPNGQLVFATFGPRTLCELKAAWASVDDLSHVNEFFGVAEIGLYLEKAGFRSKRIDTELYTRDYPSVMALMQELKGIGAHNVNSARKRKPTTKSELQRMISHYDDQMQGAAIHASYEIIFVSAQA